MSRRPNVFLASAARLATVVALAAPAACEHDFLLPPAPVPAATAATAPAATAADNASAAPLPAAHHTPAELDPSLATAQAPEEFQAEFTTTKGDFVVAAHRSWAPHGADRFYNLVKIGFFDDVRFFRAIPDFMVQFGIPGDPEVASRWRNASIADDPVTRSNLRGFVSFAQTSRPNSRTTQIFVCYQNHPRLDASGFAPFAQVVRGMEVVDSLYAGYGEGAPAGGGPDQERVQTEGNAYLDREFPKLDRILRARIVQPSR
jgi:peptidyl-prolyl cis-trans isomerase A (cyclophilin A)